MEATMTARSLVLGALVIGVLFGHLRESYAITSCNVCVDEVHPCDFPCYLGSPTGDQLTKTTCKGAGYKCLRVLDLTSDELCGAPPSTVAASKASEAVGAVDATARLDVATLADTWLRDVLALVTGIVERVAPLAGGDGVRLASR
jgi:hypothetical protein